MIIALDYAKLISWSDKNEKISSYSIPRLDYVSRGAIYFLDKDNSMPNNDK